jgi:hypothetical protein
MAFFAPPGSTAFDRVAPPSGRVGFMPYLLGDDAGFTLITEKDPESPTNQPVYNVFRSADGRTWTPAGSVPAWVQSAGRLGSADAVIASAQVAENKSEPRIYQSTGGDWTATDLSPLVQSPSGSQNGVWASDIGPFGVAAIYSVMPGPSGSQERQFPTFFVLSSRDGVTWQVDPLEELAGVKIGGVPRVLVTRDAIVINAIKAGTDTSGPGQKITLVGTA